MYTVHVLNVGYSEVISPNKTCANCTCTLIKGPKNVIIDTMTAWDKDRLLMELSKVNMEPDDIHYVVSTHGHSDHIGNNNLFLKATHIVGFCISHKEEYFIHPFDQGEEYIIDESLKIVPTPGHTHSDVSVLVNAKKKGCVAIVGDLFEKEEDIVHSDIWLSAGSESPVNQRRNRYLIAKIADYIIPGHGTVIEVTDNMRDILLKQINDKTKNKESCAARK